MNKKKIIGICTLIFVVVFVSVCIAIVQTSKHNLEDAKKDLKESYEKYGFVEKENVDLLVSKFNTQVMDNDGSSLNQASTDYLTEYNNQYWYDLIEGIYLVVVPEKYTADKATDIVDYMFIHVDKTSKYGADALTYAKHLIKANYNEATEDEINTLLDEAKTNSTTGKTAYNGKGISVGYLNNNDYYQYQVLRFYK